MPFTGPTFTRVSNSFSGPSASTPVSSTHAEALFDDYDAGLTATASATQELTNKTITAAVAKGTWTVSGTWTIPAVTASGVVTISDATQATSPSAGGALNVAGGATFAKHVWLADNNFLSVGSAAPAASALNFITLNGPTSGTGGGTFIQSDYGGLLGFLIGNYSGYIGGAFNATTTFASTYGLRFVIGDGGTTPITNRLVGVWSSDSTGDVTGITIGMQTVKATAVNFNSANSDNAITIALPPGYTRYQIFRVYISGASQTLTTSTFGLFTAAAGAGTAIIASGTANTVSTASEDTTNNTMSCTVAVGGGGGTTSLTDTSLFFRVQTAQGAPATANVTIIYNVVS